MKVYYNEIEPFACAWLSNLMDAGLITPGRIDDRDIREVTPDDVAGFRRCHFFAGVAGWELALNRAGWPEDAEVWSGSCPCQPFSSAGKRKGTADDRHLWPEFRRLIAACRPGIIFGEQVASAGGKQWFGGTSSEAGGASAEAAGSFEHAGVRGQLEALGYGVGAADLCAPSTGEEGEGWFVRDGSAVVRERITLGAPHIRQRLFWGARKLAESECVGIRGEGLGADGTATGGMQGTDGQRQRVRPDARASGSVVARAVWNAEGIERRLPARPERQRDLELVGTSEIGELGDADGARWDAWSEERQKCGETRLAMSATGSEVCGWSDFTIIPCTDGKSRRIESGSFPLAASIPRDVGSLLSALERMGHDPKTARRIVREARSNRSGRLKGYGNVIIPGLAAQFVAAFIESL